MSTGGKLSVISKKVNVRTGSGVGSVMGVVREHYLRDDVPCKSALCFEGCDNETGGGGMLPSNVTHYLMPLEDVTKHFFDLLNLREIKGIIFLQTVVNAVQLQSLRHYRKILALIRDDSKSSIFFPNEFFSGTSLKRLPNESMSDLKTRMAFESAVWFYEHLGGQKPIIMLTEEATIKETYGDKRHEVFVLSLAEYLSMFWPNLTQAASIYESCLEAKLASGSKTSNDYFEYFRQEVLEAGIRAGRFYQGKLNVDKHAASREAFVMKQGFSSKNESDNDTILIPGMVYRNRAIHGDIVAVELLPKSQWCSKSNRLGKDEEASDENKVEEKWERRADVMPTGKIVGVLERNWSEYIATIPREEAESMNKKSGKRILVIPYDYRIPKIRILTSQAQKLVNERIVVRIDNWPINSQYPNGHFVRSIGKIGNLETEIDGILLENNISIQPFSQGILDEMPENPKEWTPSLDEVAKRNDLRKSHLVMSIDPIGCEDVDDALSVRKLNNGNVELGVHIADVTHFVPPNSLCDHEARQRATTVYLADRRYDMLPSALSANVCSLLGGVDRYAVSVIWELDPNTFQVIRNVIVWYGRTVIRSAYQLFYEAAQDIIDGKDADTMKEVIPELAKFSGQGLQKKFRLLKENLILLSRIAQAIQDNREKEGALKLESSEVRFEFEATDLTSMKPKEHLKIHETVAECMIFANHWVAKKISKTFPHQSLLRRHPPPKRENFEELKKCASAKGWRIEIWSNKVLSESLNKCDDPRDPVVNLLLRNMATYAMVQAIYFSTGSVSQELWEHYGLALSYYTHFTSPIRRYADVIVHRLLLAAQEKPDWFSDEAVQPKEDMILSNSELHELCIHINDRNRAAQNAQRSSQTLFQTLFFKDKEPDDPRCIVEAVIFSIRANGFLVYIPTYAIKGPVYLQEDNDQVLYYQRNIGPVWKSGVLCQEDEFSITVMTSDGNQKYKLFDHVTVTIQMKQSENHPNKLMFYLLSNRPPKKIKDERVSLEKGEINFLKEIRKEIEAMNIDEASEMEIDEGANHDKESDVIEKRKKKSMYQVFQEMKQSGKKISVQA